ncbi:energy-coupling factor transporter transmembrane component T [Psychrobacillus sp. BL-248-WT-3]|uniref:energy-coupling factor transporter transmembrane component T family protein n=1 Tax=Psychrobacillus sp. BL-248-WT-3 TaxID=2725306 RepID=UPI00146F9252|nr:energy-coupling factor transporter transmembrane component T [Psychrobacillus sp. BL-248-WT-3]NME07199.1 energy-coupling factor transporter transmembrane protein EcfT [Psychrobacillus sp. BL-248-WT-3]
MRASLHRMNPSVKFVIVMICMLSLAFFFDPWTPLVFWFSIMVMQIFLSNISWKNWTLLMLPFVIAAFGYLWTTLLFAESGTGTVLWSIGSVDITESQLNHALSLSFRVLAFSSLSLLFALTTDPIIFIRSLMQQLKLSPKIAYGIMVGYQFLPLLKDEFIQVQQVQKLRGLSDDSNVFKRLIGLRRVLIPMLSGAVRKAERVAFAMEARGFTGEPRKVFYHEVPIEKKDFILAFLFICVLLISCSTSMWLP